MKVSRRDKLILLALLGILAALCSILFVYQPVMEKADALEQENRQLQIEMNDLNAKMENKDAYLSETDRMNREIDSIFEQFPVDVKEEDCVLLAVNQELTASMMISSIGISACEPVILPYREGEDADTDIPSNGNMPSVLMARNVTFSYLASYEGLKRGIGNISAQDGRMSIENLSVSYDEATGLLKGTTSINMYCIPGQPGKEYVMPDFSSVLLGTDNIFGSIEIYREPGLEE